MDLELVRPQMIFRGLKAAPGVGCAQGFEACRCARKHEVRPGLDLTQDRFDYLPFQKRGVAGGEERKRVAGVEKPRMDAGERAAHGKDVRDNQRIPFQKIPRAVGDQDDLVEQLRKQVKQAVQDLHPAHLEKRLVLTAVTGAQSARQNHP